ncbi:MAG: lipoyl synthase [Spirochaetales bacterium]
MSELAQLRKPDWLKVQGRRSDEFHDLRSNLREKGLHTVCVEASCPNLNECWSSHTATIMILGDTCTRGCRFCHVKTGHPAGLVEAREVQSTVELVTFMGLSHVVITSVDRDDLPDHGAQHFADVIDAVHRAHPATKVEALVPDFGADPARMAILADSQPYIAAQNLETVRRLTHPVRDVRAGYEKTLACLSFYKSRGLKTKSSLMVGLGESTEELLEAMKDLRTVGTDFLTLGQYLQPTVHHLEVRKFYTPEEFVQLKRSALSLGFRHVASGPLVRSSYRASEVQDL